MRIPAVPAFALALFSLSAFGDSFSGVFTEINTAGWTGPYATVNLTLNGTGGIDFAVKRLGDYTFGSFAWNSADNSVPAIKLTNPASNPDATFSLTKSKDGINGYGAAFQKLDYEISFGPNGYSNSVKALSFSVAKTNGTAFSSVNDFLGVSGEKDVLFALHVFDPTKPASDRSAKSGALRMAVDEPPSFAIILTQLAGLVGLVYSQRRRIWA